MCENVGLCARDANTATKTSYLEKIEKYREKNVNTFEKILINFETIPGKLLQKLLQSLSTRKGEESIKPKQHLYNIMYKETAYLVPTSTLYQVLMSQ